MTWKGYLDTFAWKNRIIWEICLENRNFLERVPEKIGNVYPDTRPRDFKPDWCRCRTRYFTRNAVYSLPTCLPWDRQQQGMF